MKKLTSSSILLLCFLIVSIHPVRATTWNENQIDTIEKSVHDAMDEYDIPGIAVSIIEDGDVVYTNTFGYQNVESNIALTNNSILRSESISKTITAYTVMHLVQEGMLSLDEPLNNYIDIDLPTNVTLHTLLTHQAGLEIGPFGTHYNPEEAMPTLKEHLLETIDFNTSKEGTFSYSNVGYNIIEYVIEQVTNMSFEDYTQQAIFTPLNVSGASFEYDENKREFYATGYDVNNTPIDVYVYPEKASGGLFTTIGALSQFLKQSMKDTTVLEGVYQDALYENYIDVSGEYQVVSDGYGYGHFIEENTEKAVFHGGQGHGWMAFYQAVPSEEDAILIITNSQRSYPMISEVIHTYRTQTTYDQFGIEAIYLYRHIVSAVIVLLGLIPLALLYRFITSWDKTRFIQVFDMKKKVIIVKGFLLLLITTVFLYSVFASYMFLEVLYPVRFEIGQVILLAIVVLSWTNYIRILERKR